MQARHLYELLDTAGNGKALREAIAPAMPAYRRGLAEGGQPTPVDVQCDGALLVIAVPHLVTLCEAYLAKQLDEVELGYLARALELAPDFQFVTEEIGEFAFLLANGTPSTEAVGAVLRLLRERAA